MVNRTELSLESLEGETLTGVNDCQEFNFSVVASLPDVPDSPQAVSTDIIPNCEGGRETGRGEGGEGVREGGERAGGHVYSLFLTLNMQHQK